MKKQEQKKQYKKPQVKVIKLKHRSNLLQSSLPDRMGVVIDD